MKIDLSGRRALVGGASGGLGKAIAVQLAASGASVTLLARNEEKLNTALSGLHTDAGQQHQILVADFSSPHFRKTIEDWFAKNSVDILVNNTSGPPAGGVLQKRPDDYQQAFDLLFQTVCSTTLAALPHMQQQGWGRIINVVSLTVKEPVAHLALSNTIRASIIAWAKTLSNEVAAQGITVNSVLTGYFDTERLRSLNEGQAKATGKTVEEITAGISERIPAKRLGRPEEYGHLVSFLASEYAGYINGVSIPIDGGLIRSI